MQIRLLFDTLWRRWLRRLSAKERLVRRVAARKAERAALPFRYSDSPRISLILLSFNHRDNVRTIMAALRQTVAEEIIVCEDGSIDGSERAWIEQLTRPNDFLIRSNDIHEIRSYNRAIDLARGEYVCVMQDDDIPPANGAWVSQALDIFEHHPGLAVLGCWVGLSFDETSMEAGRPREVFGWDADERLREQWRVSPIPFIDPRSRRPLMFVHTVGLGPIFFRRQVFRDLGGFDLSFSEAGQSGIHLDHEISLRAWRAGHQVGLFEASGFLRRVGGQGTMMFGKDVRKRNKGTNMETIRDRYSNQLGDIDRTIAHLNGGLQPRLDHSQPAETPP